MIVGNNAKSLIELAKTFKRDKQALLLVKEYSGEIPDKVVGLVTERMTPREVRDFVRNSIPLALNKLEHREVDEYIKTADRVIFQINKNILSSIVSDIKNKVKGQKI
jgi:hypothetical protein